MCIRTGRRSRIGSWPLACLILTFGGQGSALANGLKKAVTLQDPLDVPVTIEREHVLLGELLELLANPDLEPRVDPRSLESGIPFAVRLVNMPVRDVLDLITANLSYRNAAWDWIEDKRNGRLRRTLRPSVGAANIAAQLRDWVIAAFGQQLIAYAQSRSLSPDEQAKLNDEEGVNPTFPLGDALRGQANLLLDTLSKEQLGRVMRGQERVRFPVDKLPTSGRAFLEGLHANATRAALETPGVAPPPPIDWIEFSRYLYANSGTPDIQIALGDRDGVSAMPVLGGRGLTSAFERMIYSRWLLEGDTAGDDASRQEARAPEQPDNRDIPWTVGARLVQMARAGNVSMIARLSSISFGDPGAPFGLRIGSFLKELGAKASYMGKWRGRALLISTRKWYLQEDAGLVVPWSVISELRKREREAGDTVTAKDLCFAAAALGDSQLRGLATEWPVYAQVARFSTMLRWAGQTPLMTAQFLATSGLPFGADQIELFRSSPGVARSLELYGGRAVRMVEAQGPSQIKSSRQITLEVQGTDRQWRAVAQFFYQPRKK